MLDRGPREKEPDHGRRLDHGAFVRRQEIQPCSEKRLNRAGDRQLGQVAGRDPAPGFSAKSPVVDQHGQELLDEEWVSLGDGDDAVTHRDREWRVADDVVDDLRALLARERRQLDERAGSFRPIRPVVEEVGPRGTEHEERHAGHCGGQVLDQVEKRGLGPVDVLERHDQRLPFCLGLEELARRPEDFLEGKGGLRKSDRRREPGRDVTGVGTDDLFDLDPGRVVRIVFPQPRRIAHDLDERPECDPSSVGKTPSLEDARPRARSAHQLLDQPGLSGTRLGDDGGEPAIAVSNALSELAQECLELVCATNQLSLVVPLDALRLPNGQQAVCRDAFRLALQLEGLHRLGLDRMADEAIGRFPKSGPHSPARPARGEPPC